MLSPEVLNLLKIQVVQTLWGHFLLLLLILLFVIFDTVVESFL